MDSTQDILQELLSLGWNQSTLARQVPMPQPRISRWANGDVPDSVDDGLKLSKLLEDTKAGRISPPTDKAA